MHLSPDFPPFIVAIPFPRFQFKVNELAFCLYHDWWEMIEHISVAFGPIREMINCVQADSCTAGQALELALTTLEQFPQALQSFALGDASLAKAIVQKRMPTFLKTQQCWPTSLTTGSEVSSFQPCIAVRPLRQCQRLPRSLLWCNPTLMM